MSENTVLLGVIGIVEIACVGGVIFSTQLGLSPAAYGWVATTGTLIVGAVVAWLFPKAS